MYQLINIHPFERPTPNDIAHQNSTSYRPAPLNNFSGPSDVCELQYPENGSVSVSALGRGI